MRQIDLNEKTILVTGAAGFIGSALIRRLLKEVQKAVIVGVDDLNAYYDPALKRRRLAETESAAKSSSCLFRFYQEDVSDEAAVSALFAEYRPAVVVHLAAQPGVRHSLLDPDSYIRANLLGFYSILRGCQGLEGQLEHLVYASSSSVYGSRTTAPFSTMDCTDAPASLYAATKKCDELLAHAYSALYGIPATGLRFFTVYGPEGRPDMAYFSFAEKLRKGETIRIYNYGNCARDFTYIEDIVEGVLRVMQGAPEDSGGAPHALYNIGNGRPEQLMDFVEILSEELIRAGVLPQSFDVKAHEELVPMQLGDVPLTWADTADLERGFGFRPATSLQAGLRHFAEWYRDWLDLRR